MTDLSGLIARVEAASGPDRELDRLIAVTLGWYQVETNVGRDWRDPQGYSRLIPHFSASIDASRSIELGFLCVFASDIGADGLPMVTIVTDTSANPIIEYTGIAATLELAWCAAILRARQAADTEGAR